MGKNESRIFNPAKEEHVKGGEELKIGSHNMDLFDQNEDAHGQKVDEASGTPIDNTAEQAVDAQPHREAGEDDPLLQRLPKGQDFFDENDAAAAFLKNIKK